MCSCSFENIVQHEDLCFKMVLTNKVEYVRLVRSQEWMKDEDLYVLVEGLAFDIICYHWIRVMLPNANGRKE